MIAAYLPILRDALELQAENLAASDLAATSGDLDAARAFISKASSIAAAVIRDLKAMEAAERAVVKLNQEAAGRAALAADDAGEVSHAH